MGSLLTQLATWLQSLVIWFVAQVWAFAKGLISLFLAAVPSQQIAGTSSLVSQFNQYAEYANAWVPLDFGCTLVVLYYGYCVVQMTVRFIKSFVPTVSG